jgi:hypothetical protein
LKILVAVIKPEKLETKNGAKKQERKKETGKIGEFVE